MNKNKKILIAEFIEGKGEFSRIIEIDNLNYAPLIIKNQYERHSVNIEDLNRWFQDRGIPNDREELERLKTRLHFSDPKDILNNFYGLSLVDHYWLKPLDSELNYEDINFFQHEFNTKDFISATFKDKFSGFSILDALKTPNNTTNGRRKKAWTIEEEKRYLLKGDYQNQILKPFHEVLASEICKRLNFEYVPYTLEVIDNKVVSKCASFLDENTEFISAKEILNGKNNIINKSNIYEEYVMQLRIHGVKKIKEKLENMFVLDYIMMNKNRNLENFGIIRNVENLKWVNTAPIFGNATTLSLKNPQIEENKAIFFYDLVPFRELPKLIRRSGRITLSKLNNITDYYKKLLRKYQKITGISNEIIDLECELLYKQILSLKIIVRQKR